MRETKLALIVGLVTFAMYGCGDSGSGTKTDAPVANSDAPGTTKLDASSGSDTVVPATDAPVKTDLPPTVLDGGTKADVLPGTVDSAVTEAGPTPVLDGGVAIDTNAGIDGSVAVDAPASTDAPTSVDTGTTTSMCGYPSCYTDLAKECIPQGACVQQMNTGGTALGINMCYANGVKVGSITDMASINSMTTKITFKKGDAVCYTLEAPYVLNATTVTYTMKDASGATVATIVENETTQTRTITCAGGAPVVGPAACNDSVDGGTGSTASCPAGTCAL
jgi:hypothetical protein